MTREIAAKTIFTIIYIGAVEGSDRWLRPDQITRMNDVQARLTNDESRLKWAKDSVARGNNATIPDRWYAANTRESIRDETMRNGLILLGAMIERPNIPTTSSKPRYALAKDFAELLEQLRRDDSNRDQLVRKWQEAHLSSTALSRVTILRQGKAKAGESDRVKVTFPNEETRLMNPGPSTIITKAVIEEFAPRFLKEPAIVFLSESGDKVVSRDEELISSLGLEIDAGKNLPDVILVDISTESSRLVFVEVVATDGPVSESRKSALEAIATKAGFPAEAIFYITAFDDRASSAFRKLAGEIAWGSFVWFSSEPDCILVYRECKSTDLTDSLRYS